MKIAEAFAMYTGENIWLFYGRLEDGNYFLTDDYGSTEALTADPGFDWDESLMWEWQEEHMIKTLSGDERLAFADSLVDWLKTHDDNDHRGGMTDAELEAYREYFREEI